MSKIFYQTAAIDYANAAPHIGHVYEKILGNFLAQWHRLDGYDTNYIAGTDEHGEKILKAARSAGEEPGRFVDRVSEQLFQPAYARLHIGFDDFLRTTSGRHSRYVQSILERVYQSGDIYHAEYEGLYSVGSERFVTEKELVDGVLPGDSAPPIIRREANYFFRMEKYREWLIDYLYQHPGLIQPVAYRNEVLEMLKEPIGDLSISRPKERLPWGIPIPWDDEHVTYVWFDALLAYTSSVASRGLFDKYWPHAWHVIGKDILKPHAIFWPTMLKAAGLPIYERLVVHGHILSLDGRKMGKSLGNAIDPLAMLDKYGVDALHYALLRDTTLGSDSFFGEETIIARFNADLANDLGNLLSRVRTMVLRYLGGVLPAPSPHDSVLAKEGVALAGRVRKWVDELKIHLALEEVFQYVRSLNKFVNDSKPWELAKDGAKHKELEDTLYVAVEGMRIASVLLEAALPTKSGELRRALGLGDFTVEQTETWGLSPAGTRIPEEAAILFPKMERATQENQDLSQPPISPTTHQNSPSLAVAADPPLQLLPEVQIDDFAKIELRVIDVLAAEKHPKADKLLVLTVSLGSQQRTVVSGIAQWYRPEDLVGKKLILVANLKPAKLRGVDSQGMILAGEDAQGRIVVVEAEAGLPAGAKVR